MRLAATVRETQRPSALSSGAPSERLILVTMPSQALSSRSGYSRYTQCIVPFGFGTKLHLLWKVRSLRVPEMAKNLSVILLYVRRLGSMRR